MKKKDIEATILVTDDDLDSLRQERFKVDEGEIYSGRENGAFLIFLTGPDSGTVINLNKARTIIGRDTTCDVVIGKSYISKKHSEIIISDNQATITDHGSTNGTYVNNVAIHRAELEDKDEIKIGHILLQYFNIDLSDEDQTQGSSAATIQKGNAFYKQVYQTIQPHFGPKTTQFLDRQISAHIGKSPQTIMSEDKQVLAKWIKISAGLLLDESTAKTLAGEVLLLK